MRVAIAGGASPTLGASIIPVLTAINARYVPVVLTREKQGEPRTELSLLPGIVVRRVDYHSHASPRCGIWKL